MPKLETIMKKNAIFALAVTGMLLASTASAGPFILSGTDADDHGSATVSANDTGWLYMQRALENLGAAVTNGDKVVTILGSSGKAATAANSAFNFSSLVGSGWTVQTVTSANFGTFFAAGGGLHASGILMMDSGGNVGGGVAGTAFVPYATAINNFLGTGGGLFSQANGYEWLNTLLPALVVVNESNTGLQLTAAGSTAFPGLTNADLSSGPWHNSFTNVGALPVLATSTTNGHNVVIGSNAGSITEPAGSIPEPASLALVGFGLFAAAATRRRKAR